MTDCAPGRSDPCATEPAAEGAIARAADSATDRAADHATDHATAGSATVAAPSPWIERWSHLIADGATVLDVACGTGRHLRWFAARGCRVTGVDRNARATESLRGLGEVVVADIEAGPWPFAGRLFDAVVVTHYLWRPLLPRLIASLAPAGVLLYETFAVGQETIGKPSNPDFLLRPGELLEVARSLRVVAYEDGLIAAPPRFIQRIAAVRQTEAAGAAASPAAIRYPLR